MSRIYLTPTELAERLRLSRNTLAVWRNKGIGPRYLKINKKILYNVEDVEDFENKSMFESQA